MQRVVHYLLERVAPRKSLECQNLKQNCTETVQVCSFIDLKIGDLLRGHIERGSLSVSSRVEAVCVLTFFLRLIENLCDPPIEKEDFAEIPQNDILWFHVSMCDSMGMGVIEHLRHLFHDINELL